MAPSVTPSAVLNFEKDAGLLSDDEGFKQGVCYEKTIFSLDIIS